MGSMSIEGLKNRKTESTRTNFSMSWRKLAILGGPACPMCIVKPAFGVQNCNFLVTLNFLGRRKHRKARRQKWLTLATMEGETLRVTGRQEVLKSCASHDAFQWGCSLSG